LIILIIHIIVSYDQNISLIFYVKDGSHAMSLHYRTVTVHCSAKDAYTSEITFLALQPWSTVRIIVRFITGIDYNYKYIDKYVHKVSWEVYTAYYLSISKYKPYWKGIATFWCKLMIFIRIHFQVSLFWKELEL